MISKSKYKNIMLMEVQIPIDGISYMLSDKRRYSILLKEQ